MLYGILKAFKIFVEPLPRSEAIGLDRLSFPGPMTQSGSARSSSPLLALERTVGFPGLRQGRPAHIGPPGNLVSYFIRKRPHCCRLQLVVTLHKDIKLDVPVFSKEVVVLLHIGRNACDYRVSQKMNAGAQISY